MTETPALTRALVDHCVTTGTLDPDTWCAFKRDQRVEGHQVEPVLVEVIGHLCAMSRELTAEIGRLSHALSKRTG